MKKKKSIFHRLSDISRIHHRAAFADVEYRIGLRNYFLKLAAERYSCRKFSTHKVSEKDILSILEAARLAPTAVNRQPVHIWVLRSPEALEKISQATKYIFDAPLVFMLGCQPEKAWVRKVDGKNGAEIDAAIVGTHIMMQVEDIGLGSTWVGSFDPAVIAKNFPETQGYEIVALFPVGHPAAEPAPMHSERKSLEELVSWL